MVNNVTYLVIDSVTLAVAIQQRYYVKVGKLFIPKYAKMTAQNFTNVMLICL